MWKNEGSEINSGIDYSADDGHFAEDAGMNHAGLQDEYDDGISLDSDSEEEEARFPFEKPMKDDEFSIWSHHWTGYSMEKDPDKGKIVCPFFNCNKLFDLIPAMKQHYYEKHWGAVKNNDITMADIQRNPNSKLQRPQASQRQQKKREKRKQRRPQGQREILNCQHEHDPDLWQHMLDTAAAADDSQVPGTEVESNQHQDNSESDLQHRQQSKAPNSSLVPIETPYSAERPSTIRHNNGTKTETVRGEDLLNNEIIEVDLNEGVQEFAADSQAHANMSQTVTSYLKSEFLKHQAEETYESQLNRINRNQKIALQRAIEEQDKKSAKRVPTAGSKRQRYRGLPLQLMSEATDRIEARIESLTSSMAQLEADHQAKLRDYEQAKNKADARGKRVLEDAEQAWKTIIDTIQSHKAKLNAVDAELDDVLTGTQNGQYDLTGQIGIAVSQQVDKLHQQRDRIHQLLKSVESQRSEFEKQKEIEGMKIFIDKFAYIGSSLSKSGDSSISQRVDEFKNLLAKINDYQREAQEEELYQHLHLDIETTLAAYRGATRLSVLILRFMSVFSAYGNSSSSLLIEGIKDPYDGKVVYHKYMDQELEKRFFTRVGRKVDETTRSVSVSIPEMFETIRQNFHSENSQGSIKPMFVNMFDVLHETAMMLKDDCWAESVTEAMVKSLNFHLPKRLFEQGPSMKMVANSCIREHISNLAKSMEEACDAKQWRVKNFQDFQEEFKAKQFIQDFFTHGVLSSDSVKAALEWINGKNPDCAAVIQARISSFLSIFHHLSVQFGLHEEKKGLWSFLRLKQSDLKEFLEWFSWPWLMDKLLDRYHRWRNKQLKVPNKRSEGYSAKAPLIIWMRYSDIAGSRLQTAVQLTNFFSTECKLANAFVLCLGGMENLIFQPTGIVTIESGLDCEQHCDFARDLCRRINSKIDEICLNFLAIHMLRYWKASHVGVPGTYEANKFSHQILSQWRQQTAAAAIRIAREWFYKAVGSSRDPRNFGQIELNQNISDDDTEVITQAAPCQSCLRNNLRGRLLGCMDRAILYRLWVHEIGANGQKPMWKPSNVEDSLFCTAMHEIIGRFQLSSFTLPQEDGLSSMPSLAELDNNFVSAHSQEEENFQNKLFQAMKEIKVQGEKRAKEQEMRSRQWNQASRTESGGL